MNPSLLIPIYNHGATIGAMEAFLTIRGARTLALRLEQGQASVMELARRLEQHPGFSENDW